MSGIVRGVIDGYTNESTEYRNAANIWKTWFDFLESHPGLTRIALQWGAGGTGTDYWDEANPFGKNCFAVWRMDASAARTYPVYLLMQCASGDGTQINPFAAPGDPGNHSGNSTSSTYSHLMLAAAIGVGGDENPWNGTTNNDGTDSKGGSAAYALGNDGLGGVWRIPAGGTAYQAYPRRNGVGGTSASTSEWMIPVINEGGPSAARFNLIMDDDNFIFHHEGNLDREVVGGLFTPHPNLTVDQPWLMFGDTAGHTPTGTVSAEFGGAPMPDSDVSEPVRLMNIDQADFFNSSSQPNNLFAMAQFDLMPMWIRIVETPYNGLLGTFGTVDGFHQFCYNVPHHSTNLTKTRIVLGEPVGIANLKSCVPWDGTTVPGSNIFREGITF